MLARNQEAVLTGFDRALGNSHIGAAGNPERTENVITYYLKSAETHAEFRTKRVLPLTEQAIYWIDEIEGDLSRSLDKGAWDKFARVMIGDFRNYSKVVEKFWFGLFKASYIESKKRFNSVDVNNPDSIANYKVPYDSKVNRGTEQYVPAIFWIAEVMGVGVVGQSFEAEVLTNEEAKQRLAVKYYPVRFTIKSFFNLLPARLDIKIVPAAMGAASRKYDKDSSILISSRYLVPPYHFTTHNAGTAAILQHAWIGRFGGKQGDEVWENGTESYLGRYIFLVDSKDDAGLVGVKKQGYIQDEVARLVRDIILNRTGNWDSATLSMETDDPPRILLDNEVVKTAVLEEGLMPYRIRYAVLQGLLLNSFWHGNAVARCFETLDNASPERAIDWMSTHPSASEIYERDLAKWLSSVQANCDNPKPSTQLTKLKAELLALKAKQPQ